MSADGLDVCDSPIERSFLGYVISTEEWSFMPMGSFRLGGGITACRAAFVRRDSPETILVQPSVTVNDLRMRLDFLWLLPGTCCAFAIELDGHDYHERTKEQALRDRSRDRALTTAGLKPLRFTGSEVHRDVSAVYEEVNNAALDEILEWFHRGSALPADREKYAERRYSIEMALGTKRRIEMFADAARRKRAGGA